MQVLANYARPSAHAFNRERKGMEGSNIGQAVAPPGPSDGGEGRSFYTRKSSGLVREMSLSSNIATAMLFMSPPLAVLTLTGGPSALPGANPFWTNVVAAVLALAPAALWAYFLVLMPRSGGDYVFSSRALHPWIGFVANFSFIAWVLIAGVVTAEQTASLGLSSMFASLGALNHSATMTHWAADLTS